LAQRLKRSGGDFERSGCETPDRLSPDKVITVIIWRRAAERAAATVAQAVLSSLSEHEGMVCSGRMRGNRRTGIERGRQLRRPVAAIRFRCG